MSAPPGHDHRRTMVSLARLFAVLVHIAEGSTGVRATTVAKVGPDKLSRDRTPSSSRWSASGLGPDAGAKADDGERAARGRWGDP
jgi:hypothetical protein